MQQVVKVPEGRSPSGLAFANSFCSKFRWDSQYQAKSVLDWAAYLEYLRSILLEYDPVRAPTKPTMLRYFWKGLKPSILAELEHWDLELENLDQMVKKAVDAKAKSALRPRSSTKEIDQNCPRGSRPANFTVGKSQSSAIKNPQTEEPKVRGTKSASGPPQRFNNNELFDKAQKEKKNKQYQKDWERQKGSTPATRVNAVKMSEQKKKNKDLSHSDRMTRDVNQDTYWNCNQKGHYLNACPEPSKN